MDIYRTQENVNTLKIDGGVWPVELKNSDGRDIVQSRRGAHHRMLCFFSFARSKGELVPYDNPRKRPGRSWEDLCLRSSKSSAGAWVLFNFKICSKISPSKTISEMRQQIDLPVYVRVIWANIKTAPFQLPKANYTKTTCRNRERLSVYFVSFEFYEATPRPASVFD